MAKATRRKKTTAPEPEAVVEVAEDEDAFEELEDEATEADDTEDETEDTDEDESEDDDDLEELEEADEEPEEAPKPKAKKAKADKAPKAPKVEVPAFGSKELAEHITSSTGQAYDARSVRMLLRKLAKTDGSPLQRAIGEDRGRYSFTGPEDPAVKAIVKMVKSGEAQAIKREGLDKVKKDAEAKKAAKATVVEEVVEETPVKKTKKVKATTTAAPAKATASGKKKAKASA